ncbi:hypothetical protein [Escherichia coli]|uniref:Uncharacterized protein n=1 Tax=Escherichia coli TaxID=562 RepID=A0AB33I6Q6_ECOLX|nr:hypothetical protein [Escherichia coli]BBF57101.1 hypothetical protein E2863_05700 [Escherichia coli]
MQKSARWKPIIAGQLQPMMPIECEMRFYDEYNFYGGTHRTDLSEM